MTRLDRRLWFSIHSLQPEKFSLGALQLCLASFMLALSVIEGQLTGTLTNFFPLGGTGLP